MSIRCALGIAITAFVITLLVRLPARALVSLLPATISCDTPAGTIWQGSCAQLHSGPITLSGVSWKVHPGALLELQLSADLASTDPRASGQASVVLSRGARTDIHDLTAQLALHEGLSVLPRGLAGTMQVAISAAQLQHGQLAALVGSVRVLQLRSESQAADLGSFELQFPPVPAGSAIQGQLRDLGGPLSVSGQLQLLPGGGYELSGWVAARPEASSQLVQALQLLGPADAQGRRMFSLSGTL